jgi:hypothetical protein
MRGTVLSATLPYGCLVLPPSINNLSNIFNSTNSTLKKSRVESNSTHLVKQQKVKQQKRYSKIEVLYIS